MPPSWQGAEKNRRAKDVLKRSSLRFMLQLTNHHVAGTTLLSPSESTLYTRDEQNAKHKQQPKHTSSGRDSLTVIATNSCQQPVDNTK